ncbi:uncharacterized protein DDB_G0284459-like [Hetaerina americana]|uniref:uncharacterized protein DDB_G0284459-like n=1 Tax=Hetaerina americana TaxID=62018 RepID=UPI003A7F2916
MSSIREDGDTDIYGDLPNFQFDDAFKKLEQDKAYLQNKVEVLGSKLEEMKKENEKLAAKVRALGKNISCLYKTAQREIERKEKIIADLRKERDDLLFRRGLQDSKPCYTKRPSRKQLTPTKKVRNGSIKRILEGKGKPGVVNEGSITPSPDEYEKISSVILGDAEKTKTLVLPDAPLSTEVFASEEVKNIESQDLSSNKSSKILACEKRISSPTWTIRIVDETVGKEQQSANADRIPLASLVEAPNTQSNCGTVDEEDRKEPDAADSSLSPLVALDEGKSASPSSNPKHTEATTPIKDKISVHMSSEDCGFGRRRVRRVIKPSLSPATPVNAAQEERGIKRSLEETPNDGLSSWKKPQLLAVEVMQADPRAPKRRCMDGSLPAGNLHGNPSGKGEDASSTNDDAINGIDSSCREDSGDLMVISYGIAKSKEINGVDSLCNRRTRDSAREKREICDNLNDEGRNYQTYERMVNDVLKNYGSSFGLSTFHSNSDNIASGSVPECVVESHASAVNKSKVFAPRCSGSAENCMVDQVEENVQCESALPHSSPTPSCASDHGRSSRHSPFDGRMMTDEERSSRRSWDRERVSRPFIQEIRSGDGARKGDHGKSCPRVEKVIQEGEREHSGRRGEVMRWDCGKLHVPSERNGEHERGIDRSRAYHREWNGDYARDRGRSRDWDRARSRDRDRGRSRDRDGRRSRDRGGRRRSRDKSNNEKERSRDQGRDRDRLGDPDRGRKYERRESDRIRRLNGGRDSSLGRDPDRVEDHDQSRDSERGRETSRGSKDSDRSRESVRSQDGRRLNSCRSREGSPRKDGVKESCQNKCERRPCASRFDLREKLSENSSTHTPERGDGKAWSGYKDWDRPTSEDDGRNVRWCARRQSTEDTDRIRSPKQSGNQRECCPLPEWD